MEAGERCELAGLLEGCLLPVAARIRCSVTCNPGWSSTVDPGVCPSITHQDLQHPSRCTQRLTLTAQGSGVELRVAPEVSPDKSFQL